MRMRKRKRARTRDLAHLALGCVLVLLALAALASPAHAKDKKDYAIISGTVWGPDNLPFQGATVKIRRAQDKKAKWGLYSDRRGEFAQRVPPGEADYVVWTEPLRAKGLPTLICPEVKVHVYQQERQDVGLHLITEEVK